MTKRQIYITIAFLLISLGIALSIKAQVELYQGYFLVEGKTRALYELRHLKYYNIGWLFIVGFAFSLFSIQKRERNMLSIVGLLLSIMGSIILYYSWYTYFTA